MTITISHFRILSDTRKAVLCHARRNDAENLEACQNAHMR